ncbi:MAG: hypothetical protein DRK00_01670 [Thermoprotei archaeon]|nr:MAG: hypothetical protein DRK00_01670 [Thermoprotei archaeon]
MLFCLPYNEVVVKEELFVELGYDPSRDKLLILHADDVGMCHSVNQATFERLTDGSVSSASIMVPCPWVLEAAEFFRGGEFDVGVHSTLTSEWKWYKWRPLTRASGLVGKGGFMWSDVRSLALHATAQEVREELEAQVRWALDYGLKVSHLDTHMGAVYVRADFLKEYLEVAVKHGLLPMIPRPTKRLIEAATRQGLPVDQLKPLMKQAPLQLDLLVPGLPPRGLDAKRRFLLAVISELEPGTISQVIVHLGLDTYELKAIMGAGYRSRYHEYLLVADGEVRKAMDERSVHLIGWRDLAEALEKGS